MHVGIFFILFSYWTIGDLLYLSQLKLWVSVQSGIMILHIPLTMLVSCFFFFYVLNQNSYADHFLTLRNCCLKGASQSLNKTWVFTGRVGLIKNAISQYLLFCFCFFLA